MMARALHPSRRVVITGLGVVSSTGMGRQAFWEAVRDARSGVRYITRFDASQLYCRIAGEIRDDEFDPTDYMDRSEVKRSGRFVHFSVASAEHAIADAQLNIYSVPRARKGAIFGTSVAGSGNVTDDIYRRYYERGPKACGLLDHLEMAPHAATSRVMIRYEMKGPSSSVATGCCSSLDAIQEGAAVLRSGAADVMVVGASEAVVSQFGMSLLALINIMTRHNEDPKAAVRPLMPHAMALPSPRVAAPWCWRLRNTPWSVAHPSTRRSWASAARRRESTWPRRSLPARSLLPR